jgi:AraC-like DNA-binding protein
MTNSAYDEIKSRLRPGQLLDLLFNQVPEVCFFIKDAQYRFVTGNPALAQIMGASSIDEVVGKTDVEFTADFLADAFRADDRSVLKDGLLILNKLELVPVLDTLEWRCTTKVPLYDLDDQIIGLAGMTREIKDSDAVYQNHPEMHAIVDYIQSHYQEGLTKADMAAAANISLSTVERLFRKTFGITPGQYARKIRLNAACQMIRDTDRSLVKIAEACGFFDQASMTHAFRSEIKITPNRYRQRYSNTSSEPRSAA